MKNLNDTSLDKLKKCPYQVLVYGENSCELIYTTTYKGDWGDWDEAPKENTRKQRKPKETDTHDC